jgi:hypothetical protein
LAQLICTAWRRGHDRGESCQGHDLLVFQGLFATLNREIRQEGLGAHSPALTVIIAGIFDEQWLLEIEAVAAE